MTYEVDLEQTEIQSLRDAADWAGRQVLEIGCGDGRLARRVESLHASVTAIDPHSNLVKTAASESEQSVHRAIRYCISDGQRLPFAREAFDIVLFGWSL